VWSGLVGHSKKELKQEIGVLKESLNYMHKLKEKACALFDQIEKTRNTVLIDTATNKL
jgi:hypothetical protein